MTNYAYCTFILPVGCQSQVIQANERRKPLAPQQPNACRKCVPFSNAATTFSTALVDLFACNCFKFELSFYHKQTPNKFFAKQTVTSYYYICRINEQTILKSEPKVRYRITSQSVCDSMEMCLCVCVGWFFFSFLFLRTVSDLRHLDCLHLVFASSQFRCLCTQAHHKKCSTCLLVFIVIIAACYSGFVIDLF